MERRRVAWEGARNPQMGHGRLGAGTASNRYCDASRLADGLHIESA
jgi:hypothetical protein